MNIPVLIGVDFDESWDGKEIKMYANIGNAWDVDELSASPAKAYSQH